MPHSAFSEQPAEGGRRKGKPPRLPPTSPFGEAENEPLRMQREGPLLGGGAKEPKLLCVKKPEGIFWVEAGG